MDRSLKWRTFGLIIITALAALMLVPTLTPSDQLPRWYSDVFNRKIQLGLDLQGGLHIVYSIDLDKAVDDKASDIKRELEAKMIEAKVAGKVTTPLRPIGAINVLLEDASARKRIRGDFLSGLFEDGVVVERDCPDEGELKGTGDKALCMLVSSDYAEGIKKSALEQAVRTVRERIDERGVAEPNVVSKGDQIIVELPGLDKDAIQRVKDIIQRTAKLEFKVVDDNDPFMRSVYARVHEDIKKDNPGKSDNDIADDNLTTKDGIGIGIDSWDHDESGKRFQDWYLTAKDRNQLFTVAEAKKRGCYRTDKAETDGKVECSVSGREVLETYLKALGEQKEGEGDAAKTPYKTDDEHAWGYELLRSERIAAEDVWRTYYLFRAVELAGSSVANAYVYWNSTTNRPEVLVEFDRWGAGRFEEMTGKNTGKKMAIILDDKVSSAPVIQDKIGGGRSSITMGGGNPQTVQNEAQDLVNVLRTGSLPAPLRVDSESEVGPLLGRDAIEKTKLSFMLGAGLVLLVMLYFYRFSGILAIVAVMLNVLYMLALMAGFGATLTLPGIAAIVLTVGMAVDANVIIYERIREELRHGKSVKGAVDAGYHRGFAAILDGHVTTGAAGYVLYQYGSGPIKGFAVMLLIGIFTDLFTQVWCARLFFDYYVGRRRQANKISI
ncbi:MAG TPA: protein translocase subunit SecD [Kofleriaceae bacterium]|nr:protein translocase subunit SecD [Kofleriaceae bacterium]